MNKQYCTEGILEDLDDVVVMAQMMNYDICEEFTVIWFTDKRTTDMIGVTYDAIKEKCMLIPMLSEKEYFSTIEELKKKLIDLL